MPSRTVLVTGAAAGINAAVRAELERAGHRVIGVDRAGSDINVDLGTKAGRDEMVARAGELAPDGLDGVVAGAGSTAPTVTLVPVRANTAWPSIQTLPSIACKPARPVTR